MATNLIIKKIKTNRVYFVMETQTLSNGETLQDVKVGEIIYEPVYKSWFYRQSELFYLKIKDLNQIISFIKELESKE